MLTKEDIRYIANFGILNFAAESSNNSTESERSSNKESSQPKQSNDDMPLNNREDSGIESQYLKPDDFGYKGEETYPMNNRSEMPRHKEVFDYTKKSLLGGVGGYLQGKLKSGNVGSDKQIKSNWYPNEKDLWSRERRWKPLPLEHHIEKDPQEYLEKLKYIHQRGQVKPETQRVEAPKFSF